MRKKPCGVAINRKMILSPQHLECLTANRQIKFIIDSLNSFNAVFFVLSSIYLTFQWQRMGTLRNKWICTTFYNIIMCFFLFLEYNKDFVKCNKKKCFVQKTTRQTETECQSDSGKDS